MRHTSPALLSILFLATFTQMACSDYQLQLAPAPIIDPTGGATPSPVRQDPVGGGGTGGGGSSPWGALSGAEMPEEYFAVVWNDPRTVCTNCYVPDYACPRYDVIDVQGRVVVSFDLPWAEALQVDHLSLRTAGPGRFLAVTNAWSAEDDRPWKAWFGDGLTEEVEVVLEWGWGGSIYLPQADREIQLDDWLGDAHLLPDPSNPDRIYVLPQNTNMYANPLLGTLYSIDVRDPSAPVVTWSPEQMVGEAMIPEWGWAPWAPWHAEIFLDEGRAVIMLGLEIFTEDSERRRMLVSFSPQLGPQDWELDLTGLTEQTELVLRPPQGDSRVQVLFNSEPPAWCQSMGFARYDGVEMSTIAGNPELTCGRIGPVLDDEGRTFLYSGLVIDSEFAEAPSFEGEERLMISHDGIDVWQYRRFVDGMQSLPFTLHGLARITPPNQGE
jgi:hypothetical protein